MAVLPQLIEWPSRVLFRRGCLFDLPAESAPFGRRGMIIHGAALEHENRLVRIRELFVSPAEVLAARHRGGEPTLGDLRAMLAAARSHRPQWIAGVGGGSVIDLAKAVAGLYGSPSDPAAHHNGQAVPSEPLPFLAVPTTAGSGAEATFNAVLTNEATGEKKSIRDERFRARTVLLDPALLAFCPKLVIAHSGLDAFTQAVESYLSRHATKLSEQLALLACQNVSDSLEPCVRDPQGPAAETLLAGSYLAGLALSLSRLGVVHGLAHPLGTRFNLPHGLVCAICLPAALELNLPACEEKYRMLSVALGADVVARARELLQSLGVANPLVGHLPPDMDAIVAETLASGSTVANPRPISRADVEWLVRQVTAPSDPPTPPPIAA